MRNELLCVLACLFFSSLVFNGVNLSSSPLVNNGALCLFNGVNLSPSPLVSNGALCLLLTCLSLSPLVSNGSLCLLLECWTLIGRSLTDVGRELGPGRG